MQPRVVHTDRVPSAAGHISQAITFGNLAFVSGIVARDPATGEVVTGGIEAETQQVLSSLEAILEAAGTSLRYVLKATCYLRNMDDFAGFNKVWKAYFPVNPPARACIQAGRLGREFGVEVEVIAGLPSGSGTTSQGDMP